MFYLQFEIQPKVKGTISLSYTTCFIVILILFFVDRKILEIEKEIVELSYDIDILNSKNKKAEGLKDLIQRDENELNGKRCRQ